MSVTGLLILGKLGYELFQQPDEVNLEAVCRSPRPNRLGQKQRVMVYQSSPQ